MQNGKFQKDYDEAELREFYSMFEIVELKRMSKPAVKLGRKGIATNFWMVLRKNNRFCPDRLGVYINYEMHERQSYLLARISS